MKVTLGQLNNAKGALQKLVNVQLPVKKAFKLQMAIKRMNEEYTEIQKFLKSIIGKYGTIEESGQYTILADNVEAYNKEVQEFMSLEREFDIDFITIDEIPESAMFSATDLSALEFLLK